MHKYSVYEIDFEGWESSVGKLLKTAHFAEKFSDSGKETILLKPNLVSIDLPPVTTPVELIAALVKSVRELLADVNIIVAEGTGMKEYETDFPFSKLGYKKMSDELGIELIDLNSASLRLLENPACTRWPEIYIPEIVMDSFLFSVPVLKAHSMSDVTLTMKNMIGVAPPEHYDAGGWRKSAFHSGIHEAIFDLNRYRTPDFTVIDATEGMSEAHLWGASCNPPPNMLAASADPVAIDAWGAGVLQRDWRRIPHIAMADGVLGNAKTEVVKVTLGT